MAKDRKNEQKRNTEKSSLRGASCQRSSSSVPSFPATASLRCLHRKKMCMSGLSGLSGCVCLDVFSFAGSFLRKKSSQASYSAVQLTVRVSAHFINAHGPLQSCPQGTQRIKPGIETHLFQQVALPDHLTSTRHHTSHTKFPKPEFKMIKMHQCPDSLYQFCINVVSMCPNVFNFLYQIQDALTNLTNYNEFAKFNCQFYQFCCQSHLSKSIPRDKQHIRDDGFTSKTSTVEPIQPHRNLKTM